MIIWIGIILLTVILDQLTKYLTVVFLPEVGDTVPIIEDVIHFTYVKNPGAAFGMMKDARWLFMTVSTVAIIGLLVYLFVKKTHGKLENTALCFIIGGGIGNMIDRVRLEYVIDMIDFRLINFAVFNVADSFVCIGAGLLMLWIILTGIREAKAEKALAEGDVSVEEIESADAQNCEAVEDNASDINEEQPVVEDSASSEKEQPVVENDASAEEQDHDES